jgi:predicted acyl esterase
VELADGVELRYTVVGPAAEGRFPTLLNYAGYASGTDPGFSAQPLKWFLDAGFAVVGVNVRGSGCSSGNFELFDPRWAEHGRQVVEWMSASRGAPAGWA